MKLTDEQLGKIIDVRAIQRNNKEGAQALADCLEPIFAQEMLKPTDGKDTTYNSTNTEWRDLMSVFDRLLANRLAQYMPKVDPAVEAVFDGLYLGTAGDGLIRDMKLARSSAERIVAAVRRADKEAK